MHRSRKPVSPKRRQSTRKSVTAPKSRTLKSFFAGKKTLTAKSAGYILGILLILIGLYFIAEPYLAPETENPAKNSFINVSSQSAALSEEPITVDPLLLTGLVNADSPVRILIPDVAIDLPVVPARVVNGAWETTLSGASHGLGSAYPGEPGNIVIFAHARQGLFLPLREANEGNAVYLLTRSGWYRYQISSFKLVEPDAVEVVGPTETEVLTLFTCTGFLDSKRLIVRANPVK